MHQDNAVRRIIIKVDDFKYFVRAWHPDDHVAIVKLSLHVHIVVENMPMQFWSSEGAEEAFGDFDHIDRLDSHTYNRG
ncbi:d-3-phosphoglycerate chloroplastic [Hordeum vulgare]|nr:d-3-phosphoglycerate chloroplastic [Hordeum vulgare]